MYLARVIPACFPLCTFIPWGSHRFHVALACFPNFHVLPLPQARPRADCCTPGICSSVVFAILSFCFAQSSRANGVEFSGQTTCGLLHTWHISYSTLTFCSTLFVVSFYSIFVSHKVHVRTGLNNQVRPRADCCTPATFLLYSYIFSPLIIYFLSSPGSHKVHVRTGLIFSLVLPIAQSSRANGVDTLFIYTCSTKFTCERGWYFVHLYL
jgi:hypothetical protein